MMCKAKKKKKKKERKKMPFVHIRPTYALISMHIHDFCCLLIESMDNVNYVLD